MSSNKSDKFVIVPEGSLLMVPPAFRKAFTLAAIDRVMAAGLFAEIMAELTGLTAEMLTNRLPAGATQVVPLTAAAPSPPAQTPAPAPASAQSTISAQAPTPVPATAQAPAAPTPLAAVNAQSPVETPASAAQETPAAVVIQAAQAAGETVIQRSPVTHGFD